MLRPPRPYTPADLPRMESLQSACKRFSPVSSYHPGDLNWWFYYGDAGKDLSRYVTLWEDSTGALVAWAFCGFEDLEASIAVHPALRGTRDEIVVLDWVEAALTDARAAQQPSIAIFVDGDETERVAHLEARGFAGEDLFVYFAQAIPPSIPPPTLPDGFLFLVRMDAAYADQRAEVHFRAFSPNSKMTGDRYRHFMTAPRYDPDLDVVIVAPDGRFAAYVMGWNDAESGVSTFEPVGTHPDFQRRGLGRAALHEGMRRMAARGMTTATVLASAASTGNIRFYTAAGFEIRNRSRRYHKRL